MGHSRLYRSWVVTRSTTDVYPYEGMRIYRIKDSTYFRAGRTPSGQQLLFGKQGDDLVLLRFSAVGDFIGYEIREAPDPKSKGDRELEAWMEEIGFAADGIDVRRFNLPDRAIGIVDVPQYLQEYIDSPNSFPDARRRHLDGRVKEWLASESYVLLWDEEYELSGDGEIEAT